MEKVIIILQLIVAAGIFNVWVLRFNKVSVYRGRSAKSMPEEFAAYGLPPWFMVGIGILKLGSAVALIAGLWLPWLTQPAALVLAALMVGAVAMHFKVKDPLTKWIPAFVILLLCLLIVLL
ncbi:MAG: DoxX family protein [Verrucomicrobiales bacterium]|nr:DoxX family protein [Verrucomicrobiales bacterium]